MNKEKEELLREKREEKYNETKAEMDRKERQEFQDYIFEELNKITTTYRKVLERRK